MEHMAEEYATRIGYMRELTPEEEKAHREKQSENDKYTKIYGTGIISERNFCKFK